MSVPTRTRLRSHERELRSRPALGERGNPVVTENWLQLYLVESVRRDLCTQIGCTTCGAREFRLGVLSALAMATGRPLRQDFDQDTAKEIAMALAEVHPTPTDLSKLENAVRCLLFDLWNGLPVLDKDIEMSLSGTWYGKLLREMRDHHKARQSERRV